MMGWWKRWRRRHFGKAKSRRQAWYQYLAEKSAKYGFEIYGLRLNWQADKQFQDLSQKWQARGLPNDRRFFLLAAARCGRDVPGDTAECGARFGTSSYFILNGLGDTSKPHHIFDSFAGLSDPSVEDRLDQDRPSVWQPGDLAVDEATTRQNLQGFPNCHFYKGWIPERFEEVADRRFSVVHIDVDLYDPTKASLEFFYHRLNPGGLLICDDYGSADCPGATKAMDDFFRDKPESIIHIPTGQGLVTKLAARAA